MEPIGKGVNIDEEKGITDWIDDQIEIQCYFHLAGTGKLNLALLATSAVDYNTIKVSLNGKDYLVKRVKSQLIKRLRLAVSISVKLATTV